MNNQLLRSFNVDSGETIIKRDGVYLFIKNKKKYLDLTSGLTGTAIFG